MENEVKIVYVNISELIAADYNPRQWTEDQMNDLKKSITEHGFIDPVIVNSAPERKNIIIGGHFRLVAAKMLGLTTAPVVYVNIPDPDMEKKLNIRLNKVSGSFDRNVLANWNQDLLLDSGFTKLELGKGFDLNLNDETKIDDKENKLENPLEDQKEYKPHCPTCSCQIPENVA